MFDFLYHFLYHIFDFLYHEKEFIMGDFKQDFSISHGVLKYHSEKVTNVLKVLKTLLICSYY